MSPSPETLCLFLCIYRLSYIVLRKLACFYRGLGCSAVIQKLFWRCCFIFWWVFDVFMGRQVISPSYSFTILTSTSTFWWSSILVSIVAASIYSASMSVKVFLFSISSPTFVICGIFVIAMLTSARGHFIIFICISLIIGNFEHLFISLLGVLSFGYWY